MSEAMVSWAPYKHTERESVLSQTDKTGESKGGTITLLHRDLERLA